MTTLNFIPEIWSMQLLLQMEMATVYAGPGVANRDYEGEIKAKGNTVHIITPGDPTIDDYDDTTTIDPERIGDAEQLLTITEAKYFAFQLDDVDKVQANPGLITAWAKRAAYQLAILSDSFIASQYVGVSTANAMGTVAITTGDLAYNTIVDLGVLLDESNVPDVNRWVVIPPWYYGLLLKNENFINANKSGSTEPLRNGNVGQVDNFTIYKSNNSPAPGGDDNIVIAGFQGAITYAEQINQTESYRMQTRFADAIRGLHLYGGELVYPDGIATVQASRT